MAFYMCFITETWINNDHNLQVIEANITGLGYKIMNKPREIDHEDL